jgi:2-isopropylmalate synthase
MDDQLKPLWIFLSYRVGILAHAVNRWVGIPTLHKKEEKMRNIKETNQWNPETYNKHTAFVSQLALPVVALLNPQEGERILDAGCGDGTLAVEIEKYGAKVVGIDMSMEMIEVCKTNGIEAHVGSVTALPYKNEFDAVFSNATLHWVKDARGAVENIAKTLKKGGRFVAEFGGVGNMHYVVLAMQKVFDKHSEFGIFKNPWYFPKSKEYKALLESVGFEVTHIELIKRPTPMNDIVHWLDIFTNGMTKHLSNEDFSIFKDECKEILTEHLYSEKEGWVLDYVRLRVKAIKVG